MDEKLKLYLDVLKQQLNMALQQSQTDYQKIVTLDSFLFDKIYPFAIHRENNGLLDKIKDYHESQTELSNKQEKIQNDMIENTNKMLKFIMDL